MSKIRRENISRSNEFIKREKGLHFEFATEAEAQEFYKDGRSRGITSNELHGAIVIKKFKKNQLM